MILLQKCTFSAVIVSLKFNRFTEIRLKQNKTTLQNTYWNLNNNYKLMIEETGTNSKCDTYREQDTHGRFVEHVYESPLAPWHLHCNCTLLVLYVNSWLALSLAPSLVNILFELVSSRLPAEYFATLPTARYGYGMSCVTMYALFDRV